MDLIYKNAHWLLRISLSWIFLVHGLPKLGDSVANLGYVGYLIGPFEVLGAVLLLIGPFVNDLLTRIGSAKIAIIMIGAIYLHLFKWGDSIGDVEFQFLILCVCLLFLIKGNDV